ncbi:MAG: hypothetical protein E3K32_05745 [wastewater metagenome]|nr:hypothetical protein [Candidatus Loosdrechtia aerotolerans]
MLKNNQPTEPRKLSDTNVPVNTWKHVIIFLCILFLVVVLLLIYFTATGTPQAGLLEVGMLVLLFILLFHIIMKFFPGISKIFTSVIVVVFGIGLIYVNYYFLRIEKEDASFKRLLIGDLLVNKIVKIREKGPVFITPPERIRVSTQKRAFPEISLDQLREPVTDPTRVDFELLLPVPAIGSVLREETVFRIEGYRLGFPIRDGTRIEIPGLEFIPIRGYEFIVRDVLDKKDVQSLPVIFHTPAVDEETTTIPDKYKIDIPARDTGPEIVDLMFTTEEPVYTDIYEMPALSLEEYGVQPPLSEIMVLAHMIKLDEPLREGPLPAK